MCAQNNVDKGRFKRKKHIRIKIISMGERNTGKSCLIKRYCEKKFVSKYIMTIGVDFGVRPVVIDDRTVKVNFWDLSGNPDYAAVRKEFYKDAQGFILLFDVSRRETFENLEAWLKESASCGLHSSEAVGIVCGNKVDKKRRAVSESEARAWASSKRLMYYETSAKSGQNVNTMFQTMFELVLRNLKSTKT